MPFAAIGFALFCLAAPFYMPGRLKLPLQVYQLRLLPLAVLMAVGLWLCWRERMLKAVSWRWATAALVLGLLVLGLGMHQQQISRYAPMGYAADWPLLLSMTFTAALALGVLAWQGKGDWRLWAGVVLGLAALGYLHSLANFPLDIRRSDMLAMLQHGGWAWANDASLSRAYAMPPAMSLNYLPGLWLTYLPATLAGVDLRWVSAAGLAASAALLVASAQRRDWLPWVLAVFFLSPWLQFRHESYILGVLPFAALAAWGVARGRYWALALAAAWMAVQTQLAWAALPFLLWHVRLRWGWRPALGMGALILAVFAAVVGPYWLHDRADLQARVFQVWEGVFWPESPNLAWPLVQAFGFKALRPIQGLVMLGAFGALAPRLGRPRAVLGAVALGLTLFIALNSLVRDYFYFFPALFLAFYSLQEAPPQRD